MLNMLLKNGDEVYFYNFNNPNSATYEELQKVSPIKGKKLTPHTEINLNDGKLNIICGSFYMISELARIFKINIL